ncbi:hypothetical protein WS90_16250 [Burkholderia cepacia]|uniref:ESPR domain-containing protein n=1 Tax=Burkholderia cepacia TaxID=292 RepID=A0A103ZJV7_BURCE|nr:ESPR domain-containing protein [Burkholderia cepacia]KVK81338.1 hypothetical protein WS90_16250 [Burkholderia cepacia]
MNQKTYRLVYSRLRGMVVAVEETATASGKAASGERRAGRRALGGLGWLIAAASLACAPSLAPAQIAPTPGAPTDVIQTQNGLSPVNIARLIQGQLEQSFLTVSSSSACELKRLIVARGGNF